MSFHFKSMEVLRRRNKIQHACNDVDNFDDDFQLKAMKKAGCSPPYWSSQRNMTKCKSKHQMRKFSRYTSTATYRTTPPCLELEKLIYDYNEQDLDYSYLKVLAPNLELSKNDTVMMIMLQFLEPDFKEIKQVKAFGIESLIGNVGGYIGLFLGYSILQLPDFVLSLYKKRAAKNNKTEQDQNNLSLADNPSNPSPTVESNLKAIEGTKEKLCSMEEKINQIIALHSKKC